VGFARAGLFAGMIVWTVLLLAVTIMPKRKFTLTGLPRACDVSAAPNHITGAITNDRRLADLLLFVPLAILLVLAGRGLGRVALAGALVALPLLIETVQYVLPGLHQSCASDDVYDAWLGLALGIGIGIVALPLLRKSSLFGPVRARHRDPSSRPHPGDVVKALWPPMEQPAARTPTLPPPTFVPSGARGSAVQTAQRPATGPRHVAEPEPPADPAARETKGRPAAT
jgi:hypothetical protein